MPLTFAHPAAVLALRRYTGGRWSFAALVLGSMTPDAGYFIGRFELATFAHTSAGLLLACLPTGLLLLGALGWLRTPVTQLLPQPQRAALAGLPPLPSLRSASSLAALAACVLLGAWTHVFWDGFTHLSGWAQAYLPGLRHSVTLWPGAQPAVFQLLQHASTGVGLLALVLVYRRWLAGQRAATRTGNGWRYGLLVGTALAALALATPLAWQRACLPDGSLALPALLFHATRLTVAVFCCAYVCVALLFAHYAKPALPS